MALLCNWIGRRMLSWEDVWWVDLNGIKAILIQRKMFISISAVQILAYCLVIKYKISFLSTYI